MKRKLFEDEKPSQCRVTLRAIHDTMDLLSGKWKIVIIGCLFYKQKRFMDLRREVEGIRAKMLSRELKELEINGLVIRTVCNTKPITVEYTLSDYGRTLEPLIKNIAEWGQRHREVILNQ